MSFELLPMEMSDLCFSFLSFNQKMHARRVCTGWREVIEGATKWSKIYQSLTNVNIDNENIDMDIKKNVFQRITFLQSQVETKGRQGVTARIFLSRIGVGSLSDTEKLTLKFFTDKSVFGEEQDFLCTQLSLEYLNKDQLTKAVEWMKRKNFSSIKVACKLIKAYLNKNEIALAQELVVHLEDINQRREALGLFLNKLRNENFDVCLKALSNFEKVCPNTWCAAVKILKRWAKENHQECSDVGKGEDNVNTSYDEAILYALIGDIQRSLEIISKSKWILPDKKNALVIALENCSDPRLKMAIEDEMIKLNQSDLRNYQRTSGGVGLA